MLESIIVFFVLGSIILLMFSIGCISLYYFYVAAQEFIVWFDDWYNNDQNNLTTNEYKTDI